MIVEASFTVLFSRRGGFRSASSGQGRRVEWGVCLVGVFSTPRRSSANQNRPGFMTDSVAAACAMIAGWYRWPGAFTTPKDSAVASSAAPSHDHAKPDSPCRALQGEKWSEDMAASKPAASARFTSSSSALGPICSCDA